MKRVAVLTATRAEYGLMSSVIKKLNSDNEIDLQLVVTGMHLSPEFGLTYREIEEDGIRIDKKIEILLSSDTPAGISKSMGLAMISFSEYFSEQPPDALVVLGDRYETLAVCCAAMNARIPIAHIHGGEATEGLIDEAIRHSISKMSYLHFTSTELYRKRVIQLGEDPQRVFNVGALGVENVLNVPLLTKTELEKRLGLELDREYVVVTYHPVTLENGYIEKQMINLFSAFDAFSNFHYIFTKANADMNGRIVNRMVDDYVSKHTNTVVFESLGLLKYLSAVQYSRMVIGNSSSGIIEVPSFGIPTINIGDRQKGRVRADSVIDCGIQTEDIIDAIKLADSAEFRSHCKTVDNPYENSNTSDQIVNLIKSELLSEKVNLKKKFYDVPITL